MKMFFPSLRTAIAAALVLATSPLHAASAPLTADQIAKMASPQWVGKELARKTQHSKTHAAQSAAKLRAAADASGNIKSSFTDKNRAVKATRQIIHVERETIAKWLKSSQGKAFSRITLGTQTKSPLGGVNRGKGQIGTATLPGGTSVPSFGARVVLQRDPKSKLGFRIHNAYPIIARSTANQLKTFRGTPAGQISNQFRRVMPPPPRGR
jgi:hypothetical protein